MLRTLDQFLRTRFANEKHAAATAAEKRVADRKKAAVDLAAIRKRKNDEVPRLHAQIHQLTSALRELQVAHKAEVDQLAGKIAECNVALAILDAGEAAAHALLRSTAHAAVEEFIVKLRDELTRTQAAARCDFRRQWARSQKFETDFERVEAVLNNHAGVKARAATIRQAIEAAETLKLDPAADEATIERTLLKLAATIPPIEALERLQVVS